MYAKEKQPDRPVWLLLRLTCSGKTCRFCQLPLPWKKRLSRSAELVGAKPLHLLTQTALPLKSPTGAFIATLRSANAVAPNAKYQIILPLNMARVQRRRPPPAAETGRSCWGSGQQDASAAQGTMRMLGAATRKQAEAIPNRPGGRMPTVLQKRRDVL